MRILYLRSQPITERPSSLELRELAREATTRGHTVYTAGRLTAAETPVAIKGGEDRR